MLSKGCTLGCRSLIKKTDVCCLVHYSDTCVAKKKEEEIFGLRRGNPQKTDLPLFVVVTFRLTCSSVIQVQCQ